MNEEEKFILQVLSGISESEVITIFFPLLRRALVVDTRHDAQAGHMVRVMSQASSMEERIASIEKLRPQFGKVQSILGIPWLKSVRNLREQGVIDSLVKRLADSGMSPAFASTTVNAAIEQLWGVERIAYARMIKGEGYQTLWSRT